MSECCERGGREAEAEEEEGGYRTKNKNPTRQCGEISSAFIAHYRLLMLWNLVF